MPTDDHAVIQQWFLDGFPNMSLEGAKDNTRRLIEELTEHRLTITSTEPGRVEDDTETVTVSMFTARNAAQTLRYFVASAKKTGEFDYGDEQTALAELDDAIAAAERAATGGA